MRSTLAIGYRLLVIREALFAERGDRINCDSA
jgi:hypothetical protein